MGEMLVKGAREPRYVMAAVVWAAPRVGCLANWLPGRLGEASYIVSGAV